MLNKYKIIIMFISIAPYSSPAVLSKCKLQKEKLKPRSRIRIHSRPIGPDVILFRYH